MPFGVGFILLLLVIGGIAAYWGDSVGKTVGRKRLSILGLRPKYTSRIVAVGTGVTIVLFTLGTLIFASHSVRQALFGMEELQERVVVLSGEVREFEDKRIELEELNSELQRDNETLLTRNVELVSLNERLEQETLRLEEDMAALLLDKVELELDKAALISEMEGLNDQVIQVRNELNQAREQLASVEESLEFVRFLGEQFWNVAVTLYEADFVVHVGDVLHTFLVDLSGGREEVAQAVRNGLAAAENNLTELGFVTSHPDGVIRLDRTYSLDDDLISFTGGEVIDQAVDTLMGWSEDGLESVIIQISAVTNARISDSVFADLRFMIDEIVFSEGEVIASRVFDPTLPKGSLMEAVMGFLQVEISTIARNNLLPLDGDYGQVSLSEVYFAVENISRFTQPVRMYVLADQPIWAHQSLSIQFQFEATDEPVSG